MKTDQNSLVILSPGFPKDEADSTCLPAIQNLVKAINTQFPSINIVVLAFDYPHTAETYQWHNNTVTAFNGLEKRKFKKILKWVAIWRKLNVLKRKNKVIGLLSFWCGECAYIGNRYAKKRGLKHYCWIMGQDAKKENNYARKIKPAPSELIAISDFTRSRFEKDHRIKPQHVIPIGVDAGKFSQKGTTRDIDILGVGSLIPLKQFHIFLNAIAHIKIIYPAVKALLAGDGPEKENLLSLIEKYGLQESVRLAGELPHPEVLSLMQRTKILLHPSSYEGFSGVCLEALHAGAHVISFCRAMNAGIEQWHIVNSKEEMIKKALELLEGAGTEYKSINPFPIDDTVKRLMGLFND